MDRVSLKLVCRNGVAAGGMGRCRGRRAAPDRSIPIENGLEMRCWSTARTASGCDRSKVIRAVLLRALKQHEVKMVRRLHVARSGYSREETFQYTT